MIKKIVAITTIIGLTVGATSLAFAKEKDSTLANRNSNNFAEELSNGSYNSMDDFMDNMTEEDYQEMVDRMRENRQGNGHMMREGHMSRMRENGHMSRMMDESESCHGSNRQSNRNTNRMMNEGL